MRDQYFLEKSGLHPVQPIQLEPRSFNAISIRCAQLNIRVLYGVIFSNTRPHTFNIHRQSPFSRHDNAAFVWCHFAHDNRRPMVAGSRFFGKPRRNRNHYGLRFVLSEMPREHFFPFARALFPALTLLCVVQSVSSGFFVSFTARDRGIALAMFL